MTDFYCRRNGFVLYADGEASRDAMEKIPQHTLVRVKATVPRSPGYHRFYWLLVNKVYENLPEGVRMSRDALHDLIKIGAGQCELVRLPSGEIYQMPGSIAWGKMGEPEFREFMDRAIHFIVSDLIPGMDSRVLENEVFEVVGA